MYNQLSFHAYLVILEQKKVRTVSLDGDHSWEIGRADARLGVFPEVILKSRLASRPHGCISCRAGVWEYQDEPNNTNATYINDKKIRSYQKLHNWDVLRIDNHDPSSRNPEFAVMLFTTIPLGNRWKNVSLLDSACIGSGRKCDIIDSSDCVASRQIALTRERYHWEMTNLKPDSGAQVLVNGTFVKSRSRLLYGDCLIVGNHAYFCLGNTFLLSFYPGQESQNDHFPAPVSSPRLDRIQDPSRRPNRRKNVPAGDVILEANIIQKRVRNHNSLLPLHIVLLQNINLKIRSGTVVAILATTGAGKTTLMECLNGSNLMGIKGSVKFRGQELGPNWNVLKHEIAYVPQQKEIPAHLTPFQTFYDAAKLRLPKSTTEQQLKTQIKKTIELLHMSGSQKTKNGKLSGGEKTRVNLGIELVADKDLFFLDEPEQGLSPDMKSELFSLFRELTHNNGKTIVTILHDVSALMEFDEVIFLAKKNNIGRLAFAGSPQEALDHFGAKSFTEIYEKLEKEPDKWIQEED